jgi:hypothetical protein
MSTKRKYMPNFVIKAGKGEDARTFDANLESLMEQSDYLRTRFAQRKNGFKEDNMELDLSDFDAQIVSDFLHIHDDEVHTDDIEERFKSEAWVREMVHLATYLIDENVVACVLLRSSYFIKPGQMMQILDDYNVEDLFGEQVRAFKRIYLSTTPSTADFTTAIVQTSPMVDTLFRAYVRKVLQSTIVPILYGYDSSDTIGEKVGQVCKDILDRRCKWQAFFKLPYDTKCEGCVFDSGSRVISCYAYCYAPGSSSDVLCVDCILDKLVALLDESI